MHRVAGFLCPKGHPTHNTYREPTERNLRQLLPFLSPRPPVSSLQSNRNPVPPGFLRNSMLSQLRLDFLVLCFKTACSFVFGGTSDSTLDIFDCQNWVGGCCLHLVGRGQKCCLIFYNVQKAPSIEDSSSLNVSGAKSKGIRTIIIQS